MRRNTTLVVIDQGISSFSNFLLMLVVARALGPSGFGTFVLSLTAWFIFVGVSRALVFDPMTVTGEEDLGLHTHVTACLIVGVGSASVVAFWAGLLFLVGQATAAATLACLALFLPFLLLQEFWRRVGFMRGRAGASCVNDLTFLVVQVAALGGLWASQGLSAPTSVASWGAGALIAATVGFRQFGAGVGAIGPGVRCVRGAGHIGGWLALDFFAKYGLRQGYIYVVALVAGVPAVGALQAAQNLTGPTNVMYFGASAAALAEGATQARARGRSAMERSTRRYAIGAAAVVGVYCLAVGAAGSHLLGRVYGESYSHYGILVPFAALQAFIVAFDLLPGTRLRILRRTRQLFTARIAAVPIALVFAYVLPKVWGDPGVGAAAVAVALASSSAAWAVLYLERLRRREGVVSGPLRI
jgi:O-antigen/teichoic acid export membrane protein